MSGDLSTVRVTVLQHLDLGAQALDLVLLLRCQRLLRSPQGVLRLARNVGISRSAIVGSSRASSRARCSCSTAFGIVAPLVVHPAEAVDVEASFGSNAMAR